MKYLVTGGAGYIGSHMVNYLKKNNAEITIIDNLSTGHLYNINECEFINIDLRDKDRLLKKLDKRKFDGVFHFAGKSIVSDSIKNPDYYYDNNIQGTKNLIDLIIKNDLNNLIFSSSAAVYGLPQKKIIDEQHEKKPINPYGKSKFEAENIIKAASLDYNLNTTSLRYFNACGADPSGIYGEEHSCETHLIPNILISVLKKDIELSIYGNNFPTKDGTCIRDYVHVNDIVEAHYLAINNFNKKTINDNFNIGLGQGFSVLDIVNACSEVTNKKIKFTYKEKREGDPPTLIADNKKIKDVLKWNPKYTSIKEIVKTAWDWHSK